MRILFVTLGLLCLLGPGAADASPVPPVVRADPLPYCVHTIDEPPFVYVQECPTDPAGRPGGL